MTVVVIIGVLATIAVVGYRRYITSSHMAEATQMVGDIRAAQERRKQETGSYADISVNVGHQWSYPAANQNPGEFVTAWGAKCSAKACNAGADWANLTVRPSEPVLFGYSTSAGGGGTSTPLSRGVSITIAGKGVDFVAMNWGAINTPWYVVGAYDDWNGNGIYATVIGDSFNNILMTDNEGE
jgi:type IV pilus assembly protein PilA